MVRIFNIYKQELRFYRRSAVIWMAVFAIGVFVYLSVFSGFTSDITTTKQLLEGFPPVVRSAIGLRLDIFFTIFGFFGYLLTYFWLVGAIQAMNLGVGILSKETSGKTADFLLSKPTSRFKVLTSKLLAALTILILTNAVFVIASYVSALIFSTEPFDSWKFVLICLSMFFVQIFFLALGYLVSVVIPKVKTVLAWSLPITFGFFIIGLLDNIIGAENMRYVTPFKYFDVEYIITNGNYEWQYIITNLIVASVCIVVAYVIYLRKDMQAPA